MSYNTIAVRGDYVREEKECAEAVTPGHLIEINSSGKCQKHSTAGGPAVPMFALEESLAGGLVSEAYTSGERVQLGIFRSGDLVYALVADGEDIDEGDMLVSDGSGCLKERSTEDVGAAIAKAMEESDLSVSSNSAAGYVLVMIL